MLTKAQKIVYIAKGSRGVALGDSRLDGGATPGKEESVCSLVSVPFVKRFIKCATKHNLSYKVVYNMCVIFMLTFIHIFIAFGKSRTILT